MTKILVIDDEVMLREAIVLGLRAENFEVFEAEDGISGMQLARSVRPDLIVSDINMKGMDGYDTLSALRTDKATANIPFILMTGRADLKGMRHGMSLGADDYLPKPFRLHELVDVVRTRLNKQQAIREEAEHRLSELRSNISMMLPHELLTPLTGIIGMAEMIANEAESLAPAELREFGNDIKLSGVRLHRLIMNFLVYAQIEMMSVQPERVRALRAVAPLPAAGPVGTAARRKVQDAGRASDLQLDLLDGLVAMSESNLTKIVEELVDNACKFSASGKPVVVRTLTDGSWTEISVSDQGRGMKPEHVDNIGAYVQFERRIHEQQGSGLGLAIVSRLAELHGGQLTITSQPDMGTTVTVHLPAQPIPTPGDNGPN
ncbi:MAG TPA: response regulator [Opitutaceae bacterium]|nr:response regulator [Opitutaceae bacterium]